MNSETPDSLFRQASQLQRSNQLEGAIAAYAQLLKKFPEHIRALNRLGNCLMAVGKIREAALLFARATELRPDSPVSHYNLGQAQVQLDNLNVALKALTKAVTLKPDFGLAWLHLGSALERSGNLELALASYQSAFDASEDLESLPMRAGAPPVLAGMVTAGKRALRKKYMALHQQDLESIEGQYPADALARVRECLAIQHGETEPEYAHALHRPESIYFPGLAPSAWFERSKFDWMEEFESHWREVLEEFEALGKSKPEFSPYVGAGPGVPEAMQNLAGSHDWDAFHLFVGGKPNENNCAQCPQTYGLLEKLPLARLAGLAPEAFFSILRPGAHIRPHHGISNAKLAVHLPLIVPGGCAIRAGEETREWTPGECLVFDDSFEHEAWNRGEADRVVLIFEVWHPDLAPHEAEALTLLSGSIDHWATETKSRVLDELPA